MAKHARLNPSSAKRWTTCRMAVVLDDRLRAKNGGELPEEDSFAASVLGSTVHEYASDMIKLSYQTGGRDKVSADRIEHIERGLTKSELKYGDVYVDWALDFLGQFREDEIFWNVETSFPLWYEPESHGTADFWAVNKMTRTLTICDFKNGFVEVDPFDNLQLAIYGIAAYDKMKHFCEIEHIELGICQPSARHVPSWWCIDLEELEHIRIQITRAVREINEPIMPPKFAPDEDACRWCRHKARCPGIVEKMVADLVDYDEQRKLIDDDRLCEIVSNRELYRSYLNSAEAAARKLPAGTLLAHEMKMVQGNRRFSWVDEESAAARLASIGVRPYTEVLKSPAAAKKELGGDDQILDLISTRHNKPLLVPADDRRPALETTTEERE